METGKNIEKEYEIRILNKDDFTNVEKLFKRIVKKMSEPRQICIWDDEYPACRIEEDLKAQNMLGIWNQDELSGVCCVVDLPGEEGYNWSHPEQKSLTLCRFAVDPKQRGLGLADLLCTRAIEWAKERGADWLVGVAVRWNQPALSLYKKHGFKACEGQSVLYLADGTRLEGVGLERKL